MMAIRPHSTPGTERFTVDGPMLRLGPKSAVSLSMAMHELCTNAIKYGALPVENGRIDIAWTVEGGRFHWRWRDRGGPTVRPPARAGFGYARFRH
jgi:two-component sensor histidine kinase